MNVLQVGFRLLGEARGNEAGAGAADRPPVGQRDAAGIAGRILLDSPHADHPFAFPIERPKRSAGTLWRQQEDIEVASGRDQTEADG